MTPITDSNSLSEAELVMAHLPLPSGSVIAEFMSDSGQKIQAMAKSHPDYHFIALVPSGILPKNFQPHDVLSNLEFILCDTTQSPAALIEPVDALIHIIAPQTSAPSSFNGSFLRDCIKWQKELIKPDGFLVHYFPLRASDDDFILAEFSDSDPQHQKELNALLQFSQNTGSHPNKNARGFYCEELPARLPRTRLLRLSQKWMNEFLLQSHSDDYLYYSQTDTNYGFLSLAAARDCMSEQVLRPAFSSCLPINTNKTIKYYSEEGGSLVFQPYSFLSVLQNSKKTDGLFFSEGKADNTNISSLSLKSWRLPQDKDIFDLADTSDDVAEIIPYYQDEGGVLQIYVQPSSHTPLVNALPRHGKNLSRAYYAGFQHSVVRYPMKQFKKIGIDNIRNSINFVKEELGLIPKLGSLFEEDQSYVIAPHMLNHSVHSFFIEVKEGSSKELQAIPAEKLLAAINCGMIPSVRLKAQILKLIDKTKSVTNTFKETLGINSTIPSAQDTWTEHDLISSAEATKGPLQESLGYSASLRTIKSHFISHGSKNVPTAEFVVFEEASMHQGAIIPVCCFNNEIYVGTNITYSPTSQRLNKSPYILTPFYISPPLTTKNIHDFKAYLADIYRTDERSIKDAFPAYYPDPYITPLCIHSFILDKFIEGIKYISLSDLQKVPLAHQDAALTSIINTITFYQLAPDTKLSASAA